MQNSQVSQRALLPAISSGTGQVQPAVLTPRDAAQYVQLTENWLAKLRCRGGGPRYTTLGKRVRYPVQSLDEWIASNMRKSTSDNAV